MSQSRTADVLEFMRAAKQVIGVTPDFREEALRMRLVVEEFCELRAADCGGDFVEVADAIIDLMYVLEGMAITYGIDIQPLWDEVHAANMRKIKDGWTDENGKFRKPKDWTPPRIRELLIAQGWVPPDVVTSWLDSHKEKK